MPEIPEADAFAFPSLFEGLPGAVIEAMALGLPVVASDIAPNREVVEEGRNAFLVSTESRGSLAEAIERLLMEQSLAEAFGRRSREIFEQRFTLQRSVEGMIELYYRVAATNKAVASIEDINVAMRLGGS